MKSEQLFKIGGGLLSLAAVLHVVEIFGAFATANANQAALGISICYALFLFAFGLINVLISRMGFPISLYRSFTLINMILWGLVFAVNALYTTLTPIILHGIIFIFFLAAHFAKPEYD